MDLRQKLETVAVGAIVIVGALVLFLWWAYITVIVIVVGSIVTLIGGIAIAHWVQPLFEARHNRRLERERLEHEKAMDAERLQMERERFAMEQSRHTQELAHLERKSWLEEHLALTRIPANVYVHTQDGYTYLPEHRLRALPRAKVQEEQEEETDESVKQLPLPTYVRYEDVRSFVPRGHTLLGSSATGVETRPFSVLSTCWIVGGSKTGKTNTVALKVQEAFNQQSRFLVCDPHSFKRDSLYNSIKGYGRRFLLPCAQSIEDILMVLQAFLREAQRRKEGGTYEYPLTLIVDEVGSLMDTPETDEEKRVIDLLKKIARMCGQELRGFDMYGMFISQTATGLAWLRKSAMTVIAHKLLMMSERELACNQLKDVARDMDTWPMGRVMVYGLDFPEGHMILQQPVFSPAQIVEADPLPDLPMRDTFRQEEPVSKRVSECVSGNETALEADEKILHPSFRVSDTEPVVSVKKEIVSEETKRTIARLYKVPNITARDASKIVGLTGDKYKIFAEVCRELGLDFNAKKKEQEVINE